MSYECTLCGGKLKNGICTECGMDNRKSDKMYRDALNRGECTEKKLTHVHGENNEVKKYQQPTVNKSRETGKIGTQGTYKGYQYTTSSAKINRGKGENKKGFRLLFLLIFIFGIMFLVYAAEGMDEGRSSYEPVPDYQTEYPTEEFVERILNPEGDLWEQALEPGAYLVGADLPEGEYEMHGEEGSSLQVTDTENGVYFMEDFGTDEGDISGLAQIPLFEGAVVLVDGRAVNFRTENGQTEVMTEKMENPLTETIEIFDEEMVAGIDFEPGTYDLMAAGEDYGTVVYEIKSNGVDYGRSFFVMLASESSETMAEMEDMEEYSTAYRNVVFTEGSVVRAPGFHVKLVPSKEIVSEDYDFFYDKMF